MTTHALADQFDRIATGLRLMPDAPFGNASPTPMLQGEHLVGAALLWMYIRSLFTDTPKESFRKEEILVLLDALQQDGDICLPNSFSIIADELSEETVL